jgi:molecular chaperone GrpE
VSKNDPARTDPPDEPRPEPVDLAGEAAVDRAFEGLVDPSGEPLSDCQYPDAGLEGTQSEIDRLRQELAEAKDRALRTQAELENYRKRISRQAEEERRYALMPLIRNILPVWDSMGRAIEAAEKTHDTASLLEGFKMVAGQLESVLATHQCTKIDALKMPFDPNLHEAVFQLPSPDCPVNTVLQVAQTGFLLHDRVVRPSQVVVSAAVPEAEDAAAQEQPRHCQTDEGIDTDANL